MEQRRAEDGEINPPRQQPPPPPPPQKCPRCDSLNTKFCYYNNYSLSQPRYFCKTCRRYWTQGGTLRNVPVGGGCRKGKRQKTTPSSSTAAADHSRSIQQPPPPQDQQQLQLNLTSPAGMNSPATVNSYYSGGGFLSSMAAMQSLNQQQQQFNSGGGQLGNFSNLGLLQGFELRPPPIGSIQPQMNDELYQQQIMAAGNRDDDQSHGLIHQPNRPPIIGSWNPNLLINPAPATTNVSGSSFFNGNTIINSTTATKVGTSVNPNQWPDHHDIPGYGLPPT